MLATLRVVAGALLNARGEVLLARRAIGAHQGGLWEFPGGKIERGESESQALARELDEELAIQVDAARPLIRVRHAYPDRTVDLAVWRVLEWRGEPWGRLGQALTWIAPDKLDDYPMPAADRPVRTALRLPDRYLITPEPGPDRDRFLARLDRHLVRGIRLVQLRAGRLAEPDHMALAHAVLNLCRARGACLLLNAAPATVRRFGGAGVHLSARRRAARAARPLGAEYLVGASCHDAGQLAHARRIGVDFVLLSPVHADPSDPEARAIDWVGFAALAGAVNVPIYAHGGLRETEVETAWRYGAQGIAAQCGPWDAA